MSRIPGHLPRRLAICYWGFDWITSGLPEEAYGDIEKTLTEKLVTKMQGVTDK